MKERPRVVILGGGIGGIKAAQQLANQPVDVLIIDHNNYQVFQPLLYQVATSMLSTHSFNAAMSFSAFAFSSALPTEAR